MEIQIALIPGCMLGIEFQTDEKGYTVLVLDVFILRFALFPN